MNYIIAGAPMAKAAVMRIERLTKRPQFLHVAKGTKSAMPGFILQARRRFGEPEVTIDAGASTCRIGFTATKKIGNAVVRNRTKRRLRAAAAAVLPLHGRADYDLSLIHI